MPPELTEALRTLTILPDVVLATVNVKLLEPVPLALLAESVIVLVPAVVGVPEITPVVELRLKPDGRPVPAKLLVVIATVMV